MKKPTYTKEEKKQYFKKLTTRWIEVKNETQSAPEYKQLYEKSPVKNRISFISYWLTKISMDTYGYKGEPYIDMKTFDAWKKEGYIVRKHEKCNVTGIVWLHSITSKAIIDDKEVIEYGDTLYPKQYNLFHRSQVDKLHA